VYHIRIVPYTTILGTADLPPLHRAFRYYELL
jgi:hypothetical protein